MPSYLSHSLWCWMILCGLAAPFSAHAQDAPWQAFMDARTRALAEQSAQQIANITPESWPAIQAEWRGELQEMLGLAPLPAKTDLQVTSTGSVHVEGANVERLHYQSRPGLYVAANLFKPTGTQPEAGWPAVLYVCGHARVLDHGRSLGNKTNYQHHGLWLARHGIVCLIIDTIQLGEFHGEHHGTYKLGRWDWLSRGYTPAGVETWNAIRGIDLLCELPYVNAQRIGITGRSGGGAYSWFCAALDDRVRAAVPVAGITDLQNHVLDGCVEGHCDCMYFVNYFGWDYGKLASLLAPRPVLLANSDHDGIFPLDGVMRIHEQLAQVYGQLDAAENLGLLITPGPHQDTQELQVGAFKWLLRHLGDGEPWVDTPATKEIQPDELVAFTAEVPRDERVTSVAAWFVQPGVQELDPQQAAKEWQTRWLPELRRLHALPTPQAAEFSLMGEGHSSAGDWQLWGGGRQQASRILRIAGDEQLPGVVHLIANASTTWDPPLNIESLVDSAPLASRLQEFPQRTHYFVRWSGADWLNTAQDVRTQHQLLRRLALLGETLEKMMLQDLLDALAWMGTIHEQQTQQPLAVEMCCVGRNAALMELASLLLMDDPRIKISQLTISDRRSDPWLAPALLGLLRVCDYDSLHAAAEHALKVHEQQLATDSQALLVDTSAEPQQASGMRIVEVTEDSAEFWVRATRWPLANLGDLPRVEFELSQEGKQEK